MAMPIQMQVVLALTSLISTQEHNALATIVLWDTSVLVYQAKSWLFGR